MLFCCCCCFQQRYQRQQQQPLSFVQQHYHYPYRQQQNSNEKTTTILLPISTLTTTTATMFSFMSSLSFLTRDRKMTRKLTTLLASTSTSTNDHQPSSSSPTKISLSQQEKTLPGVQTFKEWINNDSNGKATIQYDTVISYTACLTTFAALRGLENILVIILKNLPKYYRYQMRTFCHQEVH